MTLASLTAPTNAAVVGSPDWLQVTDGVTYESCNSVPYSLKPMSDWASAQAHAWGNLNGYYTYDVDVNVIAPDGTTATTEMVYRSPTTTPM